MKNFLKKNLNYLLLALIVIVLLVPAFLGSLSTKSLTSPYYTAGDTKENYHTVVYETEFESGYKISAVYVNFASLDNSGAETFKFGLSCSISKTGKFTDLIDKEFSNNFEDVKPGEWHLLRNGLSNYYSYKFLNFFTKAEISVNEIAVVGKNADGKTALAKLHFVGVGDKADYKTSINKSFELKVSDADKVVTDKLFDEQNKFDLSKIADSGEYLTDTKTLLTKNEVVLLNMVNGFVNGENVAVSEGVNPLGVLITSIGTSIFGYSPFGIRIMPLLFTALTVVLLFFMGTLIFNKQTMGLVFALFFAIGGLSIGVATGAGVYSIMLFFLVFALYTLIKFYKKGVSGKNRTKGLVNILLSGIFFGLAFSVHVSALIYLLPLAVVFVLGVLKMRDAYFAKRDSYEKNSNEYAVVTKIYKNKLTLTTILFAVSYVLISFVILCASMLAVFKLYLNFFGAKTMFGAILSNLGAGLIGDGNGLYALGHVINFNGEYLGNGRYLVPNLIVTAITVVSIIVSTVLAMIAYVKGDKLKVNAKLQKSFLITFLTFLVPFVCGVIFNQVANLNSLTLYLLPSVMGIGIAVNLINYCLLVYKKELFEVGKIKFTAVGLALLIISVLALVSFGLSIPSVIGATNNVKLFAFNVFGKII